MNKPIQVVFRGMPHSAEVEERCLAEARKLENHYDCITSCRVILARPHRQRRHGNLYDVRIDLAVPGGEIVIDRGPPEHQQDEELQTAVRDAFDRARRRVEDFVRKRRARDRVQNGSI